MFRIKCVSHAIIVNSEYYENVLNSKTCSSDIKKAKYTTKKKTRKLPSNRLYKLYNFISR